MTAPQIVVQARGYLGAMSDACGRRAVVGLLTLQLLAGLLEGAALALLLPVIEVLSGDRDLELAMVGTSVPAWVAVAVVILVLVLRAFAQWAVAVRSFHLQAVTADMISLGVLEELFHARWSFIAAQRRSHLVQNVTTETYRAEDALYLLGHLIVGMLTLVATAVVAIWLSPAVGALATVSLVLVVVVARRTVRNSARLGTALTASNESFGGIVTDSLASLRLIRAHDAADRWAVLLREAADQSRDVRQRYVRNSSAVQGVLSVLAVTAALALVLLGRGLGMGAAALITLAVVTARLMSTAQALVSQAQLFAHAAPALDRLTEFRREVRAHLEPVGAAAGGRTPVDQVSPLLEIRDLTVRYPSSTDPVLESVDLVVPRQGLVAVSGQSGAGKSTLLDVVLGLLEPERGTMLVDGAPVTDMRRWRARIGYVPQQTTLVPGTIRQNLVWSAIQGRSPSDADLWAALETACLDGVVRALPHGLDAELAELAELSGGEQQRLSLARAVVREPDLLVLDEATSALDAETESRVLANLLGRGAAILLVTHRLTLIARADIHYRMDGGRLERS